MFSNILRKYVKLLKTVCVCIAMDSLMIMVHLLHVGQTYRETGVYLPLSCREFFNVICQFENAQPDIGLLYIQRKREKTRLMMAMYYHCKFRKDSYCRSDHLATGTTSYLTRNSCS